VQLYVQVTPRGSHNRIIGWKDDTTGRRELMLSVTSAPVGGKATKDVCALVAESLHIAKGKVTCVRGATSRHKQLEVEIAPERFEEWLKTLDAR
jgi:uncharacterized protein